MTSLGETLGIVRRELSALTVAAYLVLGTASWIWGLMREEQAWHPALIVFLVIWTILAIGLVLRQPIAYLLLLLIEGVALFGWVEEPDDWGRFAVQVALVLLLISPPVDRWAAPPTRGRLSLPNRLLLLLVGGAFLVAAIVNALDHDLSAIPLLTIAAMWLLLDWRLVTRGDVASGGTRHP